MRVGFLFNHDGAHQAAHSAPAAFELARRYPDIDVTVIVSSEDELETITSIGDAYEGHPCEYIKLDMRPVYRILQRPLDEILPYKRLAILKSNLDVFKRFDALVVPEKTSLLLKRRYGLRNLTLIHARHGAGDRAVGFNARSGDFDFVLLPGRKVRDRLLSDGLIEAGRYEIVGYPKFDVVKPCQTPRRKLFGNDNPTVLYNPHFDPSLSSWYGMGRRVLEFFYRRRDYNLIFAPHVMLFKRRFHVAPEKRRVRLRADLPAKYARCPHILVDTGSPACCDMTYTQAADIYLGDVSSQVYEFLIEPRPCIFLNAHGARWNEDPNYLHWCLGPVVSDPSELGEHLARANEIHALYRRHQENMFRYTFDLQATPSSVRAAAAIARYLHSAQDEGHLRAASGTAA